ncbi:MAG TPA: tyrosine-type recombinase/integrase [Terriglobales bacterium]|nr:tyrosine-type recombinase/integrase [Terriglobales bacterium]
MEEVKVYVIDRGRTSFYLRYIDPTTGRPVEKSAATSKHSSAVKAAGKWEADLNEGRYQKPSHMSWEAFKEFYSTNAMPALAMSSQATYEATFNVFERICNPQKLSDVTTAKITGFVTRLRENGLAEATVARHLRQLKAITRWANREGVINDVPKFTMPKRVKGSNHMRGRPITTEEFERMIEATAKVVENTAAKSWKFYLKGLWTSGLRLTESLTLSWNEATGAIVVDLSGRRPMLRIPTEAEKGNRNRLLPMAPEFAALLETVPESDRHGRVFKLLDIDARSLRGGRCVVGKIVSAIGKSAHVLVNDEGKSASAHDLRRAFGLRWAQRVMPTVLRELMRHEDISTTMKFYVGQNAEATADLLWAAVGDTFGDTPKAHKNSGAKSTAIFSTGGGT